jgi:hypothetical protein
MIKPDIPGSLQIKGILIRRRYRDQLISRL